LSPRLKRQLGFGLLLLLMLAAWAWLEWRGRAGPPLPEPKAIETSAVRVGDGDTFRMGGRTIRLAGIDAPELAQTCTSAESGEWPCGREARDALARLLAANGLQCEERAADRYRRALSVCRTEAGDVGEAMVRAGLALGARDPRFDEYPAAMAEARGSRRGLWQGAHQHPADWRAAHPRQPRQSRRTGAGERRSAVPLNEAAERAED
jgi:endonuclease YncB( thermonuclease family)